MRGSSPVHDILLCLDQAEAFGMIAIDAAAICELTRNHRWRDARRVHDFVGGHVFFDHDRNERLGVLEEN